MRSGLWGIAVAGAVVATSGYAVAQGGPAGATCDREFGSRAMSYITSIDHAAAQLEERLEPVPAITALGTAGRLG